MIALAWLWPAAAIAQPVAVAQTCHAPATIGESWRTADADGARWTCNDSDFDIAQDSVLIRYTLAAPGAQPLPHSFVTHASRYDAITTLVVDDDGAVRSRLVSPDEVKHIGAGPLMVVPLPAVDAHSRTVMVRIDRPWVKNIVSEARLDRDPQGTGWPLGKVVAMAAICGMLCVPLLLNAAFYTALPERYVIWHLAMVVSMLTQAVIGTGFVHLLGSIPEVIESPISNLCYATMASSALMFAAAFIEPGKLSQRLRGCLRWGALGVLLIGLMTCLFVEWMRPWSTALLHLDMLVAMGLICCALLQAWRRGSGAVFYQITGWTPVLVVGVYRVFCYFLPGVRPTDMIVTYQLALAIEVLVTALGIISRFIDLRRERDTATALARELEGVAGHDPLTGLRNRRSIERRFDELFRAGFRTMAVIDLDHFKSVNDTHGHAMGDTVLKVTALALVEDRDTRAIRIGGEEFMLLLRGRTAAERAERYRRAISSRVAGEVPGLDRVITASMGMVEHDTHGTLQADFDMLYTHCDRLLYEAKRLGRNRTMRERVTSFATDTGWTRVQA